MKIRNGFVSNSSSSSFVAVGFYVPEEIDNVEIVTKLFGITEEEIIKKTAKYYGEENKNDREKQNDVAQDLLYDVQDKTHIRFLKGSDDGVENGEKFIGKILAETSAEDSFIEHMSLTLSEVDNFVKDIKEKLEVDATIIILTGTRAC